MRIHPPDQTVLAALSPLVDFREHGVGFPHARSHAEKKPELAAAPALRLFQYGFRIRSIAITRHSFASLFSGCWQQSQLRVISQRVYAGNIDSVYEITLPPASGMAPSS